jgi:hypothetical protein
MSEKKEEHPKEDVYTYIKARITKEMGKVLDRFLKKHSHDVESPIGGGCVVYEIIPTSAGEAYSVKCIKCKIKKDLTDYKNW